MLKRIYAQETEYGGMLRKESDRHKKGVSSWKPLPANMGTVPVAVFKELPGIYEESATHTWHESGRRFYSDSGRHPELATPECSSPEDAVLYTVAGDKLLREHLNDINADIIHMTDHSVVLARNNAGIAEEGNGYRTFGNHMNVSFVGSAHVTTSFLGVAIAPFVASMMCTWGGSGWLYELKKGKFHFLLSQRMPFIMTQVSDLTLDHRGLVNTRDEPHTIDPCFRRLHITGPDTLRSEYIQWLRFATLGLVIGMAEDPTVSRPVSLSEKEFVKNRSEAMADLSLRKRCWKTNKGTKSSLEIQWLYLNSAKEYYASDQDALVIIDEWYRVLTLLIEDPYKLDREIEWMVKERLFSEYVYSKYGLNDWRRATGNVVRELQALEIAYSYINESSIYEKLLERGLVRQICSEDDVARAMFYPPSDTRAHERGELITRSLEQNSSFFITSINWSSAKITHKRSKKEESVCFRGIPGKCPNGLPKKHIHIENL